MRANVLLASAFFLASALPALAWDNTNTGRGPNQIVDGGPGAQATAASRATAGASARSTSRGGNGYGGAGGSATGGAGGTGVGTVNINGSGYGGGSGGGGGGRNNGGGGIFLTVPDGTGQASCGGGLGIGGLTPGAGGSGGGTLWEFKDCKVIREANELRAIGRPDLAMREMCQQIDRVREAMGGSCDAPVAPTPESEKYRYDYCFTASAGERMQHKECAVGK
jgi:hypothetical protein